VKMANDVNDRMPSYVVQRVMLGLNRRGKAVNGSRVLVLGLAYKKNSNDARETPATGVIEGLLRLGAEVRVIDDHVGAHAIYVRAPRVELSAEELRCADVVIVITDHDSIDYEWVARHSSYVFDARRRVAGDNVELL
jgi:UDP-N-acetyl-D-glucosamine dehydrogenase